MTDNLPSVCFDDDTAYGWLAPDGSYYPVDFSEHEDWAYAFIRSSGWADEYKAVFGNTFAYGDFMVEVKGWVLLHNPDLELATVTKSKTRSLTKAQREFLFDYYSARNENTLAKKYLTEGDNT